ncbi:MAG: glyoxylase-like metal-dependent hydrolase (beta-lactamase superfamily II) [Paracoccaceae bacterium]|jgi:glyoxylase-like metal-dependent hydrolase (beta-lactamase superfamily II)
MRKTFAVAAAIGLSLMFGASASAQLPPGFKKQELTKISDSVYSFRNMFHRTWFMVTDDGVIVADPISEGAAKAMLAEIRKVTDKPVKYLLYSHEHGDHASGGQVFRDAGATLVSHAGCVEHMKAPGQTAATLTWKGAHVITLGGKSVEMFNFGPSHGNCMAVMRIPSEKLGFIVDIVSPGSVAFKTMRESDPDNWIATLRKIEAMDFDRFIPGHGPPTAPKSAVTAKREYLELLTSSVKMALAMGKDPASLATDGTFAKYAKWRGYKDWVPMNIDRMVRWHKDGK